MSKKIGLVAIGTVAAVAVYYLVSLSPEFHQIKMAVVFRKQQSVQTPYITLRGQGHVEPTAILMKELKKNSTVAANSALQVKAKKVNARKRWRMEIARLERALSKKVPFMENASFKESTCPIKTSSITKYSKWFRQRYKPNIKLFLDRDDLKNSKDMAKFPLPFGIKKNDFDLLLKIVTHPNFRNTSAHLGSTRKECLRCAVVGCGGILKGSRAGPEIDGHDYVFRLNHAYTKTFESDVGKRTSFYIFFPESMTDLQHPVDKDAKFILAMFKVFDMNYALNMLNGTGVLPLKTRGVVKRKFEIPTVDPTQLRIVHPDFFRYVATEYLNGSEYRPTTGTLATFLALHICDEVSMYGFGYDHQFSHHYYDEHFISHSNHMTKEHDVESERSIWYKLNEEGVIRLLKRDIV